MDYMAYCSTLGTDAIWE